MKTAKECIHCHICQKNCDFLAKYGIDIGDTDKLKELAYHCFLCGKCTEVCPIDIDGRQTVLDLRRETVNADASAVEKTYKGVIGEKRNYKFRNWKNQTAGTVFFPGCNFPSLFPKTSRALSAMFAEHGIGTVYDCCGKPIAELGFADDENRIISEISDRLKTGGINEIIVACPNCRAHFGNRLGIKVTGVFEKLSELGLGKSVDEDVKFFIPCPDRFERKWVDEIKPFVNGEISFVNSAQCCGLGGNAIACEPDLSKGFTEKLKGVDEDHIYAYCASCTGRIKRNGFDSIDHILTRIVGTNESPDTGKSYLNRVFTKFK